MKKTTPRQARCVCEDLGHFRSGVPGILAHVKKGRITGRVERCDACQRFRDDQVAEAVLRRILKASAPQHRDRAKIHQSRKK